MKRQTILSIMLSLVLLLTLSTGSGLSQSGERGGGAGSAGADVAAQISPIMSYQGRLVESGIPVTGTRNMTFRLYDVESGGSYIWQEGPKSIALSGGLFSTMLGESISLPIDLMDQMLWLEIQVGSTILPRQKLTGAPYAFSLVPGAEISGNPSGSALYVKHSGSDPAILGESMSGHGVTAKGHAIGGTGSALWAENLIGIAIWGKNGSEDAALVLENGGTGALIKGFGADGGEDELRIGNEGSIATKADTYLFVPGTEAQIGLGGTTNVTLSYFVGGAVHVDPTGTGTKDLIFGVTLPGVLYGQPVKVEQVSVFYRTSSPYTCIAETKVQRQYNPDIYTVYPMGQELIDQCSTTTAFAIYDVPVSNNNVLSVEEGMISILLNLYFDAGDESIVIGGIRVRLGHHPLY